MPYRNRGQEIVTAIRKHLKVARRGSEPITDESLMAAAACSRRTFYKYVTKGSEIEREIEAARREQEKNAGGTGDERRDSEQIIRELREERDQAREVNRGLLGNYARLIANLKSKGVRDDLIQWAQDAAMEKPDRSVSHASRSRRKRR
jgi:hypothetical protein